MNVSTGLPLGGAYRARGERVQLLRAVGYDPFGPSLGHNLLADPVCRDSLGHPLGGGTALAALAELRVQVGGALGAPDPWGGVLLFTQ